MRITRKSNLSGEINTMDIGCTEEQYSNWENGMHIQDAMPNIPAEEREFIISGITPQEWNELFGENEDE